MELYFKAFSGLITAAVAVSHRLHTSHLSLSVALSAEFWRMRSNESLIVVFLGRRHLSLSG